MNEPDDFVVLPAGQMREKYHLCADNCPTRRLDPENVPPDLRGLIPLAEQFGIADDLIRLDLLAKTPAADVGRLRASVRANEARLMEWLAGPAADGPTYSDEYIAFSAMVRAADAC